MEKIKTSQGYIKVEAVVIKEIVDELIKSMTRRGM